MMDMDDRFHRGGPKSPPASTSKAARRGMGGEPGPGDHRRGPRSSLSGGGAGGAGSLGSKTKFTHTNVIVGTYGVWPHLVTSFVGCSEIRVQSILLMNVSFIFISLIWNLSPSRRFRPHKHGECPALDSHSERTAAMELQSHTVPCVDDLHFLLTCHDGLSAVYIYERRDIPNANSFSRGATSAKSLCPRPLFVSYATLPVHGRIHQSLLHR
jgi:hypothetical protein